MSFPFAIFPVSFSESDAATVSLPRKKSPSHKGRRNRFFGLIRQPASPFCTKASKFGRRRRIGISAGRTTNAQIVRILSRRARNEDGWKFLGFSKHFFFFVGVVLKNFLFSNVPTRSLLENLSGANNKRIFSLYLLLKKGGGSPKPPLKSSSVSAGPPPSLSSDREKQINWHKWKENISSQQKKKGAGKTTATKDFPNW